jgi:ADP-heptose:LPS heptosyltransferase
MRIVVVNLNRLGDIVQSSPIVTTLRREYPTARIVLLVRTEFAWVAERIEGVDEVVRWNIGEIQALVSDETRAWVERADRLESLLADPRLRGADLLVNASHNDAASALARLFEPVRVIGQRLGAMGTPTSENLALRYFHELLHFRAHNPFNIADLYRMAGGKAWAGAELAVRPGDGKRANAWLGAHHIPERARLYGIQPGASQAEKRWPPVRCAAFARHVVAADEEGYVLVFGSPGESALVDEVVAIEHPTSCGTSSRGSRCSSPTTPDRCTSPPRQTARSSSPRSGRPPTSRPDRFAPARWR